MIRHRWAREQASTYRMTTHDCAGLTWLGTTVDPVAATDPTGQDNTQRFVLQQTYLTHPDRPARIILSDLLVERKDAGSGARAGSFRGERAAW